MATLVRSFLGFFGRFSGALSEKAGQQVNAPGAPLVADSQAIGPDSALQISTVWACIDRRSSVLASLPFFVYESKSDGQKTLARSSRLYQLLHDSPNARMTPMEFWRALVMNHDLRGAGYARIERDPSTGEAISLWPMPTDQVSPFVLADGTMVYEYRIGSDLAVLSEANVLVIKGLGNGTTGLDKLAFMRATTTEAAQAQAQATRTFASSGKPTGVLMIDRVLGDVQRKALQDRFAEMAAGSTARLYVLEADMKYQQLSLTPEQQQLLSTRQFSVEEICRWFDVPPVLAHGGSATTWGSGIEQIVRGWYMLAIGPMLVNINQAVRKRVMTPAQRARMTVEISFDALLRGDPITRAQVYASGLQNGYYSRAEVRQLENLPPLESPGAQLLTAQSNLVPIDLLGKQASTPTPYSPPTIGATHGNQEPVAQ